MSNKYIDEDDWNVDSHAAAGVSQDPAGAPVYNEKDEVEFYDTAAPVTMQIEEEETAETHPPAAQAEPPAAEVPDGLDDLEPEPVHVSPEKMEELREEALTFK